MIRFGNSSALGKGRALVFRTPEDAFTDESDVAARHIRDPDYVN